MKNLTLLFVFFMASTGLVCSQDKIDVLILNRQYDEALQLLEKRIQKQPEASLYLKKGLILNSLQNYQEAIIALAEGLEVDPENNEIRTEIADAYSSLGNSHEASPFYEEALNNDPANLSLAAKFGRNCIQLNKFEKAYEVFSGIYTKDSTQVFWNKQFAYSAYQTGKIMQAISLFEKVIAMNPGDYSSYINLVKLYGLTEQQKQQMRVIELGLVQFPGDAELYNLQAYQYFNSKQYHDARMAYENYFLAKGDSAYKILLNYGVSLYFSKDEEKAISILEICAGQIANDPYVLFYLSLSHKKFARYEIAEDYMNAAIEAATPHYMPEMYHHLGQIYGQQRMFEESIAALKKANELDPTSYEVLFEIATTYEEYNSNKTLAWNYYNIYLQEAGEAALNASYALDRMTKIKEEMFFGQ